MSVAFVALGMVINVAGRSLGLSTEVVADAGAMVMIAFGLVLVVPRLSQSFATAAAGFAQGADATIDGIDRSGLGGQFATGALLGAVWSPCIGPTLGGAIALASQGESLGWAGAIMTAFALGVSTLILALAYGARGLLSSGAMHALAERSRPIMGWVLIAVGAGLLLRVHHFLEFWALENLPAWLMDLSVSI
ncbi:MAG: cytochrome c biogenesis protein CcdA, partial [Pseudomonadota bacterium]